MIFYFPPCAISNLWLLGRRSQGMFRQRLSSRAWDSKRAITLLTVGPVLQEPHSSINPFQWFSHVCRIVADLYQTEPKGAALSAIQASRSLPRGLPRSIYRFEICQLILCRSSSSLLVALVKSQPLAQHATRLRQWAFPPRSVLCVLCLVARHIVKLNDPVFDFGVGVLPLPSHSSAILVNHNISIGEAGPWYGARKQMGNRDDQKACGDCRCEERRCHSRFWVKEWWHDPG